MQNTTHPHPAAMAKTESDFCAGICHTGEFASYVVGRIFASDDAYELERRAFTRCTEAHQRGDMEAFHSAWHAEVSALMALGDGGDFFGAMGERDRSRLEGRT